MKTFKNHIKTFLLVLIALAATLPAFSQDATQLPPGLYYSSGTKVTNPQLEDAYQAFIDIKNDGQLKDFKGEPWIATMAESHVQGILQYKDYYLLTHNNKGYSKGKMMIINREKDKLVKEFDTPYEHYNHPGGLQVIGDYAAVAIENSSYDKSRIAFYDLRAMDDNSKPTLLDHKIKRNDRGAGAVGITSINVGDKTRYWVAALRGKKVDFYCSNDSLLSSPNLEFTEIFTAELNKNDYQGIQLLSDQSNQVYLIGFRSESEGTSYKDKMVLFRIDLKNETATKLKDCHMKSEHGASIGKSGVHFRWGAGLSIVSEQSMKCFATQRNWAANKLYTNTFKNKY